MTRSRSSKTPYVYRAKYPREYIDGYIAKVVRKSGRLFAVFQLADFEGDHARCQRAAAREVARFLKEHPKLSRQQLAQLPRAQSKGKLPIGVRRLVREVRGRKYAFYEASWSPEPNVQKKKRFSITRYGAKRSLMLALKARRSGVASMVDGIH